MVEIKVTKIAETDKSADYKVIVDDGASNTEHTVTLTAERFQQYAGGAVTEEKLIEESFRFLLEREPKESILASFELEVIERYFPEFSEEIGKRLS